jgi:hypothetical protein
MSDSIFVCIISMTVAVICLVAALFSLAVDHLAISTLNNTAV